MKKKRTNKASATNGLLGGRPEAEIDMLKLAQMCQLKPTMQWAADFFGVDPNTIRNQILRKTGLTWDEFRDRQLVHTRFSLIQKCISMAQDGDRKMLSICLKELCDWEIKKQPDISINNLLAGEKLDDAIIQLVKDLKLEKE